MNQYLWQRILRCFQSCERECIAEEFEFRMENHKSQNERKSLVDKGLLYINNNTSFHHMCICTHTYTRTRETPPDELRYLMNFLVGHSRPDWSCPFIPTSWVQRWICAVLFRVAQVCASVCRIVSASEVSIGNEPRNDAYCLFANPTNIVTHSTSTRLGG
jgi:hypothetical protein